MRQAIAPLPDRRGRALNLGDRILDLRHHVVLFLEILRGDVNARQTRIHQHSQCSGLTLRPDRQPDLVTAWCHLRSESAALPSNAQRIRAQIPVEPVQAGDDARHLPAVLAGIEDRTNDLVASAENRQRHRLGRDQRKRSVDDRAVRRFLSQLVPLDARAGIEVARVGHATVAEDIRLICLLGRGLDAVRVARREQMRRRYGLRRQFSKRGDVVQDPERAPVGREHQIALGHDEIGDRRDGHVQLQRLPAAAVVERDVHAELAAGVEQPLAHRILSHDANEVVGRNAAAVGEKRPRLAVIVRPVDVRTVVVRAIGGHREERAARVVGRRLDRVHQREPRHVVGRHVLPIRAVVARHLHEPVVGAGPEDALFLARPFKRRDGRPRPSSLSRSAARRGLPALVAAREIGADDAKALAAIARSMHDVRRVVDVFGIER